MTAVGGRCDKEKKVEIRRAIAAPQLGPEFHSKYTTKKSAAHFRSPSYRTHICRISHLRSELLKRDLLGGYLMPWVIPSVGRAVIVLQRRPDETLMLSCVLFLWYRL